MEGFLKTYAHCGKGSKLRKECQLLNKVCKNYAVCAELSCKKLRLVWNVCNSRLPFKEKMMMFQSACISTVVYG